MVPPHHRQRVVLRHVINILRRVIPHTAPGHALAVEKNPDSVGGVDSEEVVLREILRGEDSATLSGRVFEFNSASVNRA